MLLATAGVNVFRAASFMSNNQDWAYGEEGASGAPARRTKFTAVELALQLWRAKWLMILVFIPVFIAGLAVAFIMPETYEARSRLLVSLGDEYIYRPAVGNDVVSTAPEFEELMRAELELIQSPVVAERTLDSMTLEAVFPDMADGCARKLDAVTDNTAREKLRYNCYQSGVLALQGSFAVSAAPKTPVLLATFKHEDAGVSAAVLNAAISSYLSYRSEVFSNNGAANFGAQRARFERLLNDNNLLIRDFLIENDIGDFESERATVRQLYQAASSELSANLSRARVVGGQLRTYAAQLQQVSPEQDLFVEDSTNDRLLALQFERQEKLTRYTPDSRAIKEVDRRIAQAKEFMEQQDGAAGTVRRGPNPVFQEIETASNSLRAEAEALKQQEIEIQRQLDEVSAKQLKLSLLEPRYEELLRKNALLRQNVQTLSEREVEAETRAELFQQSVDNIKVLEVARPPVKSSSLKLPVAALAFLFAGFTALMAGLLRAFTRPSSATSSSIERSSGLPVLSTIPTY